MYGSEDGSIPATFEILYMIGWKPHESQVRTPDAAFCSVGFCCIHVLQERRWKHLHVWDVRLLETAEAAERRSCSHTKIKGNI